MSIEALACHQPDAVIPWTGRHMAVEKYLPHLRNEYALHRWDVAGVDEIGLSSLGAVDLVEHSVGELGRILLVAGRQHDPTPEEDFRLLLRSEGQPDLYVEVADGSAGLVWSDGALGDSDGVIEFDCAARHLFIWGRRPDRAQTLLSGY